MNKITNWIRYLIGILIGMIGEYLYRSEFYTSAFTVLICLVWLMLIDITDNIGNKK
jgi:hypothetical protein